MVHRFKDVHSPPSGLVHSKWDSLRTALLKEMHLHEVNSSCYRDETLDDLAKLYKNKCAICERDRGTELQVDHYRPKKARKNKTNIKYNQPGYYWLAYEWSNLIPLCSKCNGSKSNKFPLMIWTEKNRIYSHLNPTSIIGFDAYDIHWLQSYEKPFMINPEVETVPERHFLFKNDGKVKGRTLEGKETIKICKLNSKDLIRERLSIKKRYVDRIKSALDDFSSHSDESELRGELKGIFKTMKKNCHQDEAFSLYHIFLYNYFEYFIESDLPSNIRGVAIKYFREFNN